MSIKMRIFAGLFAVLLSFAWVQAAAADCDIGGTVNGTALPTTATAGQTIVFTGTGFTPGEAVSFWFTAPNGVVIGTPAPIPGGVNSDGTIGPLPLLIDQALIDFSTGRWAITFQGASSQHQAIIYFCLITTAQATATAQAPPPTATSLPATDTPVPPSATSVPPTDTAVPIVPTVEATVTVPLATVLPTSPPATVAPTDTAVPVVVAPTATLAPVPTAVVNPPGMPTTGAADGSPWLLATLLGLMLLTVGVVIRRRKASSAR